MRRYVTEQQKEKGVLYVKKTTDTPSNRPNISLPEAKDHLIKERGVRVRDALEVINQRHLKSETNAKASPRQLNLKK